jgi:FG-GAP repeat
MTDSNSQAIGRATSGRVALAATLAVMLIAVSLGLAAGISEAVAPRVSSASSSVPVRLSPDAALAKTKPTVLVSPKPQKNGEFGYSVAVAGTTAVVGAPFDKVGSIEAGRAFIFNTETGVATNLTSPNGQKQSMGYFGYSVAVSGSTVVVGAPYETVVTGGVTHTDAGRAYLYSASTGHRIRTLEAPTTVTDGVFGVSVAISGTTVVVGASGSPNAGQAFVFSSTTGDLISTLVNPNGPSSSEFGEAVAINGSTVLVGAPYVEESGDVEAGAAYTFSASTGELVLSLASPDPQVGGNFGASVAISTTRAVVGAPNEADPDGYVAGYAYTFSLKTGDPLLTLDNPIQTAGGHFGYSVAIGSSTVVVGAWDNTLSGVFESGAAYTFHAGTGKLNSTLKSSHALSGGGFGASAAISGSSIVIGANSETSKGKVGAGNAYLFG